MRANYCKFMNLADACCTTCNTDALRNEWRDESPSPGLGREKDMYIKGEGYLQLNQSLLK